MALELKMLAFSIVLGLVQIVLASHAASLRRGYVWTAGSRDDAAPSLTGVVGRLARTLQNFVETFPMFAAVDLIANVAATHSWMTEQAALLYFWVRVTYSPCTSTWGSVSKNSRKHAPEPRMARGNSLRCSQNPWSNLYAGSLHQERSTSLPTTTHNSKFHAL